MRSEKKLISMLVLMASTSLIYQNCGNGLTANSSPASNSASSTGPVAQLPLVPISITPVQNNQTAGANIDFNVSGVIPGNATYAWSNVNNGNSICLEVSRTSDKTYSIRCASSGNVLVTVALIQQGQVVGSSSSSFSLGAAIATPTPSPTPTPTPNPSATPTPTPDPQMAVGLTVYNSNCMTCHYPITISNIRYTSVAQVTSVITGNLQNMHNNAGVTALILLDATNVANMSALVFALGH